MGDTAPSGTRLHGLVLSLCTGWAILGGVVLLAVVAINVASVVGAAVLNRPIPGDFELTEVGVAVAAFAFLPYCQIAGLNVTADIFTARASKFWLSLFALLGAAVALAFGAILAWRMFYGMQDKFTYNETTAILSIPTGYGFMLALPSLALLVVAAFASLVQSVSDMAGK